MVKMRNASVSMLEETFLIYIKWLGTWLRHLTCLQTHRLYIKRKYAASGTGPTIPSPVN